MAISKGTMFESAGQAEILRSSQKDQFYLSELRGKIADVFQSWAGARVWLKWRAELDLVSDCVYFGLTTLSGLQTLGEEYVNIIQVDHTQRSVPSIHRRWFLVFSHIVFPYLVEKSLSRLSYHLEANLPVPGLPDRWRARLSSLLPIVRHVLLLAHRTHMAYFYLRGIFYHIAKRSSGTQYLMVRRGMSNGGSLQTSFHILGVISLIQLLLSVVWQIYQWTTLTTEVTEKPNNESLESVEGPLRCSLCLSKRRESTATPCGHLFCWFCIMEWCATKPECPLCRDPVQPSQLIFLQHYGPS